MGFFFLFYILIYFLKYETIVSRNGLSLGYSEQDTSSVIKSRIIIHGRGLLEVTINNQNSNRDEAIESQIIDMQREFMTGLKNLIAVEINEAGSENYVISIYRPNYVESAKEKG